MNEICKLFIEVKKLNYNLFNKISEGSKLFSEVSKLNDFFSEMNKGVRIFLGVGILGKFVIRIK